MAIGLPHVDRFDTPLDDDKVYGAGLLALGKIQSSVHSIFIMSRVLDFGQCFRLFCVQRIAVFGT